MKDIKNNQNSLVWNERWHLARLPASHLTRLAMWALVIGFVFLQFHFLGNTVEQQRVGRSIFRWLIFRWERSGGDFSHGWLIPFISLGLIYWKREEFFRAKKQTCVWGLFVILLALLMHYTGAKIQMPRISVFGLILLIWGLSLYFYGWQVAKLMIFPCAYLIFCVPMLFLNSLTFPLKLFVAQATDTILNGLGIAVVRSGSVIAAVDQSFQFNVDAPCSGLRSLLALTAITAVYANLAQKTLVRKWALFLASIPIAVIGNIARILSIGLVAQVFGQEFATKLYHDYSGFIFFPVAIGLVMAFSSLLNSIPESFLSRWLAARNASSSISSGEG